MSAQNSPSSTYSNWFSIESWFRVNLEYLIAEEEEGHLDHGEKDNGGTERNMGWCTAHGILRDVDDFDSRIQQGESVSPPFRFLGLGSHGRNLR